MKAETLIDALGLPQGALIGRRVPKKALIENGNPTAAVRRQVQDGIDSIQWIAALKPSNCGVPAYSDNVREYLEIAVLSVELRPAGKPGQLLPLLHRVIPYPTIVVAAQEGALTLSMAHKRWSRSEKGQVVVDGEVVVLPLDSGSIEIAQERFLAAISLEEQLRTGMFQLYQGWIDVLLSMKAVSLLGDFVLPRDRAHAAERSEALRECERLETEMKAIRAATERERQIPRRAELNLELRRLADAHAVAKARL